MVENNSSFRKIVRTVSFDQLLHTLLTFCACVSSEAIVVFFQDFTRRFPKSRPIFKSKDKHNSSMDNSIKEAFNRCVKSEHSFLLPYYSHTHTRNFHIVVFYRDDLLKYHAVLYGNNSGVAANPEAFPPSKKSGFGAMRKSLFSTKENKSTAGLCGAIINKKSTGTNSFLDFSS